MSKETPTKNRKKLSQLSTEELVEIILIRTRNNKKPQSSVPRAAIARNESKKRSAVTEEKSP